MNKNSIIKINQKQRYRILIINLRKQQEEKYNEKIKDKNTDSNQSD